MMFNEPSFCLFVLKSPWPCPRAAGQKWLMAHATHTPHGSRLTRLVVFLLLLLLLLTATNDVVVFVVVDVGCWLSIRMLVVGFVACSDLWSASGCCGDGCFLILIKQFYFLVRLFFFSRPKKDVVNAC